MNQVNTTLSLATNAEMMMTNLKAELPSYITVWFDPQDMRNVLSFGNIATQYPIRYLQESDRFQVQLCDHINIFGHEQVDNTSWRDINLKKSLQKLPHPKRTFPKYQQHHMS